VERLLVAPGIPPDLSTCLAMLGARALSVVVAVDVLYAAAAGPFSRRLVQKVNYVVLGA